jgi:hypothetical protein
MTALRLQTPMLELRWPSLDDLDALADLAAVGVHDPGVQPFLVAWHPRTNARSQRCSTTGPSGPRGSHRIGAWNSSWSAMA